MPRAAPHDAGGSVCADTPDHTPDGKAHTKHVLEKARGQCSSPGRVGAGARGAGAVHGAEATVLDGTEWTEGRGSDAGGEHGSAWREAQSR